MPGSCRKQRNRLVDPAFERDVLPLGDRPREIRQALADVADREVLAADLHLAALDLGQVEDVVDHREEHPAGRLDVAGVTAMALVELLGRRRAPRRNR